MKTLMTTMLGLALVTSTASLGFAQGKDAPKDTPKKAAAKGVCSDKSKPGKDGKCKDGSDPAPAKGAAKKKK